MPRFGFDWHLRDKPIGSELAIGALRSEQKLRDAISPLSSSDRTAASVWFEELAVELGRKGTHQTLTTLEHSYAADRCFTNVSTHVVAQEVFAARLGSGELWTP